MNIGLIAMSGIRVCDKELLRLGLTLPGFVERSKVIASLPSLGLLTLAGMVSSRHKVHYIEVADLRDNKSTQNAYHQFDLIAISSFSAQIKEAYQLAEMIRQQGVRVVMGGIHVTSLPEEAKQYCDTVVIGDGELSWPTLLADAERRELKPFYGGIGQEFDLNEAPMPAFELLDIDKYNRLTVQTSRGCPHQCEFCASSILLTQTYKQKPVEKVLAEIDKIKDIWDHAFIEFADDNAFVNRAYWKILLPKLKKRNIRWFTETDISIAKDEELLTLMRESGCAQVLIGLESPSEASLNGIETKRNWKAKQSDHYKEAIHAIQSRGISVNGCFILGLDKHGPEIFDQVFNFVSDTGLHEVQITIQTAFPGTQLYERLKAQGRIIVDNAWEKCTLFDINYFPQKMTVDELSENFRDLGLRLYSDKFTKARRESFKKLLRQTVKAKSTDDKISI